LAVNFLVFVYVVLKPAMFVGNIVSLVRDTWFSMLRSLSDTRRSRGLLPLDGVMLSVFCSVDRSVHFSFTASEILIPVSFSVWSSVAVWFPHEAISSSISVSVGMNGSRLSGMKRGLVHWIFMNLRNAS